jgi:hypothetical protein
MCVFAGGGGVETRKRRPLSADTFQLRCQTIKKYGFLSSNTEEKTMNFVLDL